jgi:hypothetical protein
MFQMRLPPTEYAKLYRHVKRNDPEFRKKNAERSRRYRLNLSDEKRARNRETARIRQQRYLQRLKLRDQLSQSFGVFHLKTEPQDFDDLKLEPTVLNLQLKQVFQSEPEGRIQSEPEGPDQNSVQSEPEEVTE